MAVMIYSLSNLFRIYLLRRYIQIFLGEGMEEKVSAKEVLLYGSFFLVNTSMSIIFHCVWLNILINVVYISLIVSIYTKSVKTVLFLTCFIYMIHMGCDVITSFLLEHSEQREVCMVSGVTTAFLILICELLMERIVNFRKNADEVQSIPLIFVPICSMVTVIFLVTIISSREGRMIIVAVSISLLFINFVVLYLYNMLQNAFHQKYENDMLKHKVRIYANQMNIILQNESKVRALKHDMKHHMNELKLLAIKNEDGLIQEYIDSMEEFIHNPKEIVSSGNTEIDSVLNYMLQKAKDELKEVNVGIRLPEATGHSFDINVILANLLENAIEAAKETEEKLLNLKIGARQGVLRIEIENSFCRELLVMNGEEKEGLQARRGTKGRLRFQTTKKNKEEHGFGLKNVQRMVEKHNGIMEAYANGKRFFVKLILYI